MTWLFSKRCKDILQEKKIRVSLSRAVRARVWKALEDFNEPRDATTETGFNYSTSTLEELPGRIEAELGLTQLLAFPKEGTEPVPTNLEGFVIRGNYPPYVFDTLELFYRTLEQGQEAFQNRINDIMDESTLPWRMANGKVFPVDSAYVAEQLSRALRALPRTEERHRFREFIRFMDHLLGTYPSGELHVALENVSSHASK